MRCRVTTAAWRYDNVDDRAKLEILSKLGFKFEPAPMNHISDDPHVWIDDKESVIIEVDSLEYLRQLMIDTAAPVILRLSLNPEYDMELTIYDDYVE